MSADNYMVIVKGADGKYRGFTMFASDERPPSACLTMQPAWERDTMEDAAKQAQTGYLEYGYEFHEEETLRREAIAYSAARHIERYIETNLRDPQENADLDKLIEAAKILGWEPA